MLAGKNAKAGICLANKLNSGSFEYLEERPRLKFFENIL